jgi:CheY-like chemotaxis protein
MVRLPVIAGSSLLPPFEEEPHREVEGGGEFKTENGDGHAFSPSGLRILVVDDNRDSADSLSMILKARNNETRTAYDGEEALSIALEFEPDVVLLDIGLPQLDGYDTCRGLRSQPGGDRMVIFAQTGWGQVEDRRRTQEAGFDHHLVKPIELPGLFMILSEVERSKRL